MVGKGIGRGRRRMGRRREKVFAENVYAVSQVLIPLEITWRRSMSR